MSMRQSIPARTPVAEKLEIRLTKTENSICELLDECVKFLREEKGVRTSCRAAGGWVRDKVNPNFI
jgi:tRNA nucleotidyltransferase (CCA-adding enzyme)